MYFPSFSLTHLHKTLILTLILFIPHTSILFSRSLSRSPTCKSYRRFPVTFVPSSASVLHKYLFFISFYFIFPIHRYISHISYIYIRAPPFFKTYILFFSWLTFLNIISVIQRSYLFYISHILLSLNRLILSVSYDYFFGFFFLIKLKKIITRKFFSNNNCFIAQIHIISHSLFL